MVRSASLSRTRSVLGHTLSIGDTASGVHGSTRFSGRVTHVNPYSVVLDHQWFIPQSLLDAVHFPKQESALTILNGVDLAGLAHDVETVEFPPEVKGRTVHIDADFLAYMVTAEKTDGTDDKTYEDMQHNAEVAVRTLQLLAAAEKVHLHLTPSTSNKGDRFNIAMLKEYQGNRADKEKPRYLNIMREWLAKRFPGTLHQFCEADDGMASAQYAAIASGDRHLSIIASKDKDLSMVPGLHVDWDTGEITDTVDDFGYVELYERKTASGTVKKLKGFGQKFFWAQMLTGDPADNISGLPKVSGAVLNKIKPTAAVKKAQATLESSRSSEEAKALAQVTLAAREAGPCGPATAILMLDLMSTPKIAFETIKNLYRAHGETHGFTHWKTGEPVAWGQAFASEARLLWMRKNPTNADCVLDYMRQCAA